MNKKDLNLVLVTILVVFAITGCKKGENADGDGVMNGHSYVDLGLPSGTLWATCNIGADNSEDYGNHFAWGEIQPKAYYILDNYKYFDGQLTKYNDIDGLTTLETMDDVATINWGGQWRIPTEEQWKELQDNTKSKWTSLNGVKGRIFIADNGKSVFLPAAGRIEPAYLDLTEEAGDYWSSSLCTNNVWSAYYFNFNSDTYSMGYYSRYTGFSIRPVCFSQKQLLK